MSTDYLDGNAKYGFPIGEMVIISSGTGGKSLFAREIIRRDLKDMVKMWGPLPWDQFQRMASSGYGTGAVGRLQKEREKRGFLDRIRFFWYNI